jgi:cell division protein FtsB
VILIVVTVQAAALHESIGKIENESAFERQTIKAAYKEKKHRLAEVELLLSQARSDHALCKSHCDKVDQMEKKKKFHGGQLEIRVETLDAERKAQAQQIEELSRTSQRSRGDNIGLVCDGVVCRCLFTAL